MTEKYSDEHDAVTDEGIFAECAERFSIACTSESENRAQALGDLQFLGGDQWPHDLYRMRQMDNRPALVINHTEVFTNRVVNNLKQARPRIKCHPVGDGADIETAEVINGLVRHIENISRAEYAYDLGGTYATRMGWGYWRIVAEYLDEMSFDQELKIRAIQNPFTVYIDPSAVMPDGSDARWVIITEKMKRSEFRRRYPREVLTDFTESGEGDSANDWENKEEIRLAEYYRITERRDKLYRMADGSTRLGSTLPSKELMEQSGYDFARDEKGQPICRESSRRQVCWHRITGKKIADKRELPGHWIPVVRCEGNALNVDGEVTRKGMVRSLKDPARMTNYWRSCETELVALQPKAPFIGAEGQFDGHPEWEDANQKTYSRLEYKVVTGPDGVTALPAPTRNAPPTIPAGAVNAAQGAYNDLMSIAGMPNEPNQDTKGKIISGKALRQRQMLSDNTHFQFFDNQMFSIAHTGRILLDLIPHYYDTERMQRIIREDGTPEMVKLNAKGQHPENPAVAVVKNDLQVGRYDVVMDTGPAYQTKREEGAEAIGAMLSTPLGEEIAKTAGDLIVRATDVPYAAEIADRLMALNPAAMQKQMDGMPKQAQTVIGALQRQVQMLQQSLQQVALELKYKTGIETGWMHLEREKFKDANKVKEFDTQVRATTARDVAEITAASKLLNTEQEARHHTAESERLIEAGLTNTEH